MSRLEQAIGAIHELDELAMRRTLLNRLHPVAKLVATLAFLVTVLSFPKYALSGVLGMGVYPLFCYQLADLPLIKGVQRFKNIAILLLALGLANVYFDTAPLLQLAGISLSGGWISLAVLLFKGLWSFLAVYLLIATTGMEQICYALQCLHLPRVLIVTLLLTYRYLILLLKEGSRISAAYALRAPDSRGIAYQAWGTLLGQLLLRSIDRAQLVYESMALRGFDGTFRLSGRSGVGCSSLLFAVLSVLVCLLLRVFPVFELLGSLL